MEIRFADFIEVVRAQALLGRRRARVFVDVPQKLPLELLHTGSRKEYGWVVLRD